MSCFRVLIPEVVLLKLNNFRETMQKHLWCALDNRGSKYTGGFLLFLDLLFVQLIHYSCIKMVVPSSQETNIDFSNEKLTVDCLIFNNICNHLELDISLIVRPYIKQSAYFIYSLNICNQWSLIWIIYQCMLFQKL